MKYLEHHGITVKLKRRLEDFHRLLFPYYCVHCGQEMDDTESLCTSCKMDLISMIALNQTEKMIKEIFSGRVPILKAGSLYCFENGSPIQDLLHALKYQSRMDIGSAFGKSISKEILKWKDAPDEIIPVPVHPKKRKIRGYNQSEIITEAISEASGISERKDLLLREQHTVSNTKLNRWERWLNVGDSFKWNGDPNSDKHYLLVDDVLTTGATIEACIQSAIKESPNSRWSIFSAAIVWRD